MMFSPCRRSRIEKATLEHQFWTPVKGVVLGGAELPPRSKIGDIALELSARAKEEARVTAATPMRSLFIRRSP